MAANAALEAIKIENNVEMFAAIARISQKWVAASDIEIMQLKARLYMLTSSICHRIDGPMDIMQSNLQPYPAKFICEIYLGDEESATFATRPPPGLPYDASDVDILAIFSDLAISFMVQDRHDESKVRFIKMWQDDGNIRVIVDNVRWESFEMEGIEYGSVANVAGGNLDDANNDEDDEDDSDFEYPPPARNDPNRRRNDNEND